ncbi:MAG TPA: hypothetical protein VEF76_06730 [Patescibacteria group bacterium]|nr:hypothetical protein [Patescibacteria group bacterium]
MKSSFRRGVFIFLIAALFSGIPSAAQASEPVPEKIQRNWAAPDCGKYDEALVLSRFFYFRSTKKDMTLLPAALEGKQGDYWQLELGNDLAPVKLEEDGVLKIGIIAAGSKKSQKWDGLTLDSTEEYMGCVTPPKLLPKQMIRLMRYIDRIKLQCTVSVTNECAGVLFKLADEDSDKKVTKKEIQRAVAATIIFAELAERQTVSDKDSVALIKKSQADGGSIADELIATYDKDKSKSLDYNELMEDFHAPSLPIVKVTLNKAGALLPSFKVVAMGLD